MSRLLPQQLRKPLQDPLEASTVGPWTEFRVEAKYCREKLAIVAGVSQFYEHIILFKIRRNEPSLSTAV